jgi:glycosyltransferase involved in cell wall biosynthesis
MLLSVCMIVKNEERFLPGCLRSVEGLADELVIVDTGSEDKTKDIVRAHGATLLEYPWTGDFSAARNVGLAHARGEFVLYIDADEEVVGADREPLRQAIVSRAHDAISVEVASRLPGRSAENVARYVRVFKNHDDVRFSYPIHEQI